ncbi:MAG: thioredoxin domain-containing protein [Nostocales cyanobacterium 94392]|nr:thioredoxin domain-containing protein [Nostocales cyanobacterium 94392]
MSELTNSIFSEGRDSLEQLQQQSTNPILVKFVAPHCPACKTLTPILEQLVHEGRSKRADGRRRKDLFYKLFIKMKWLFYLRRAVLVNEGAGKMHMVTIDMTEEPELAMELGVRTAPTVFFLQGKKVVDQIPGLKSKKTYVEAVQKILTV